MIHALQNLCLELMVNPRLLLQSFYPGLGPFSGSYYGITVAVGFMLMGLSIVLAKKQQSNQGYLALQLLIPALLVAGLALFYYANNSGLNEFFQQRFEASRVRIPNRPGADYPYRYNGNIQFLGIAWTYVFRLLFCGFAGLLLLKNSFRKPLLLLFSLFFLYQLSDFLFRGLDNLATLRTNYLQYFTGFQPSGDREMNLYLRYISYLSLICAFLPAFRLSRNQLSGNLGRPIFDLLLWTSIVIIGASEIMNMLDFTDMASIAPSVIDLYLAGSVLMIYILARYEHKKYLEVLSFVLAAFSVAKIIMLDAGYMEWNCIWIILVNLVVVALLMVITNRKIR